jgi:hypothetical protein
MKTITRRVRRLEERYGPPAETAHTRYLAARLEAARRRMVLAGYPEHAPEGLSGLTTEQILLRGCERARQAAIAEEAAERLPIMANIRP